MRDFSRSADGCCRAYFTLPPEFIGFSGHFPGRPILPAVAQVQMGCLVFKHALSAGQPLYATPVADRVDSAKFMRPVAPGERILVTCAPGKNKTVTATLRAGDTPVASYVFTPAEDSHA